MQLNETTLVEIAQAHGDSHIRPLEIELINLKRRVITDKLVVQEQRIGLDGKEERYRPPEVSAEIFVICAVYACFHNRILKC